MFQFFGKPDTHVTSTDEAKGFDAFYPHVHPFIAAQNFYGISLLDNGMFNTGNGGGDLRVLLMSFCFQVYLQFLGFGIRFNSHVQQIDTPAGEFA